MEFLICNKNKIKTSSNFHSLASLICLLASYFFSCSAFAAISHDQSLEWQTLNSRHFELHFHDGEEELAEKCINIAEKVLLDLQPAFNWIPKEKIEIILTDEFDDSNGFVIAPFLPSLRMTLYPTAPDDISELDDWLTLLITHELTHALHVDKASGNPLTLRKFFGRHPLSFPNIMQPAWLLEGLATYLETDNKRQTGRGQDDIFHMMMRMEVKKGIKSYEEVNMDTANWPVGTTRYLYGVHFFQFLESQYSRASIFRLIEHYSDNLLPFALNSNSIRVYGKTMPELWRDFEEYLNRIYIPQLSEIATANIVEGEKLTDNGYYKNFVQPLENGNLLYAQYDGKTRPALLIQKPGINETEMITEIRRESRLDYHPEAGVISSQIEIYRNVNYLYDLFKINLNDKNLKRMTRGERYRRAVWSPNGEKIIALYNKNNNHTLALLNDDGQLIDLLWEGKSGETIADMDWSPDGNFIVASIKRQANSWNIEEFSLAKRSWKTLINGSDNEVDPSYSPDGDYIVFSANYGGVYNLHRFERATQEIKQISNVEGGAFQPVLDENNTIYYIGYGENGYDIFKLANNALPGNIKKQQESRKTVPSYEPVPFEKTHYSSFNHLKPTWWTPSLVFGTDILQIGGYITGSDALKIHSYDAKIAFDLESNGLSGEVNYTYDRWFPVIQTHISSINRINWNSEIINFELLAPLLEREKKWYIGTVVRRENINHSDDLLKEDEEDNLIGIGAIYDTRKSEIISNSPSNSRLVTLTAETSELLGADFNGKMFIAKWQEYIALKPEHVLAMRFISGLGLEQPRKFQLGGNFNDGNYYSVNPFSTTPFRSTLYNQRHYALRGYPTFAESLRGRRMMMYNLEWRFPLKRIEKSASSFPSGLHQFSGALFMESGSAWNGGIKPKDFHYSVGAELKTHLQLFYYFSGILRAGYAYGMDEDGEHQFYLNVGSSF